MQTIGHSEETIQQFVTGQNSSHTLIKVMLKILLAKVRHYVNHELPDVQAGFRKGKETRDQIVNICWIMEKRSEFQKNIFLC